MCHQESILPSIWMDPRYQLEGMTEGGDAPPSHQVPLLFPNPTGKKCWR